MKFQKLIAASMILMCSQVVNAEIVQGDWKSGGDNLAFIDTDNGTEWLSVTATTGWSLSQLESELQAGGTLEGWRIPNQAELESVFSSIMPSVTPEYMYGNKWSNVSSTEWDALRDLFWGGNKTTTYMYGWTRYDGDTDFYRTGTAWSPLWSGIGVTASNWGSLGEGSRADTGFFLVADGDVSLIGQGIQLEDVPAPLFSALAGLCFFGLRRKGKVS